MGAAPEPSSQSRRAWTGALLAAGIGLVVTIVMAAPVLRSPSTRVFGAELVGRHYDPFAAMARFAAPFHLDAFTQPLTDLPGHLLAMAGGPVAAYNDVVLLSFPLSALTAFLFAWYLTRSRVASIVAGLAFAFSPFHLAHAAYHPQIAQTQWVPLYFLALLWALDRPRPARLAGLVAAALALAFSNFYGGFIGAVLTPVVMLAWWLLPGRGPRPSVRGPLIVGVALLAAVGATVLAVYLTAPHVLAGWERVSFPRHDLFRYSAKWWAYLMPPAENPWLGAWAERRWTAFGIGPGLLEEQVSLGWTAVLLAAVPVWRWVRGERDEPLSRAVPFLVVLAAAALVCSLSPERRIGPVLTIRPSYFLYEIAPMFRSYARFGVVVQLAVAVLAGAGVAWLLERRTAPRTAVAALLVCGLALEYAPLPPRWRPALPGDALPWIAAQPGPIHLLECRPPDPDETTLLPSLLGHPVRFLGGVVDDCGEPGLAGKLAAAGVTEVLVPPDGGLGAWFARRPVPDGFARVRAFEDGTLLRVTAAVPAVYTVRLAGYDDREYLGDRSWRWMSREGSWTVVNTTSSPVEATLAVELTPFPAARVLGVELNGAPLPDLALGEGRRSYSLGPLTLSPGANTLAFRALEPPVVADTVEHNGDQRALSVALGDWRWQVSAARVPSREVMR
jgi:hypothetical protein